MATASNQIFTSTPITNYNDKTIARQFSATPIAKDNGNIWEMMQRRRLRQSLDVREKGDSAALDVQGKGFGASASNQICTSTPIATSNDKAQLRQFPITPIAKDTAPVLDMMQKRRLRQSMDVREKCYECAYCAQTFKLECNLIYHELVHQLNHHERKDIDEPFVCVVCGMRFGEKAEMDRHREVHVERNVQRCSICQKKYGNDEHLQRHERIHEWINSVKEHGPVECSDAALIFQSDDVNSPQKSDQKLKYQCRIVINELSLIDLMKLEPKNGVSKSKSDNEKSQESDIITISISSDSDSNIDDGPSPEVPITKECSSAQNHVTNCPQPAINFDKENFKCLYCSLVFEQIEEKLKHECQFHKLALVLTKIIVPTTENAVANVNDEVPTETIAPKVKKKQKKGSTAEQKPVIPTIQNHKTEKLERDKVVETVKIATIEKAIASGVRMTRQRCKVIINQLDIDLIPHTVDGNYHPKKSQGLNEEKKKPKKATNTPKFDCLECNQRFTTKESRDQHQMTHTIVEPTIETSRKVGEPNNQCVEMNVSQEVIEVETEIASIEPGTAPNQSAQPELENAKETNSIMPKLSESNSIWSEITVLCPQIPTGLNFKCSFCTLIFTQIDEKLKHECIAHSLQVVIQRIEDKTSLNATFTIENVSQTKDNENSPNKTAQREEIHSCRSMELDTDVQQIGLDTEIRPNSKRKRSVDTTERSDTDDSGKRFCLTATSAQAHQQINSNSSIVNDIHTAFNDIISPQPFFGQKEEYTTASTKENIHQSVSQPTLNSWQKSFHTLDGRQLSIGKEPASK